MVPVSPVEKLDPVFARIGDAVRRLRVEKGVSQERLALLAEVDRSYVGRVERGENNVSVTTLMRIAASLEMTLGELFIAAGV